MRAMSTAARITRSKTGSTYATALIGEGSAARDMSRANPQGSLVPNPSPTLAHVTEAGPPMSTGVPATIATPMDTSTTSAESEDDLLLEEPTTERRRERKTLLVLRQEYKRTKSALNKTLSHLEFLKDCDQKRKIPKGLQINITCNAPLADMTDVKERFTGYKDQAEHGYKQALLLHYSKLEIKLRGNLEAIIQEMEETVREASQPERDQHTEMLCKRNNNILKEKEELLERKKRKLEYLEQPQNQGRCKRNDRFNTSRNHPYQRPQRAQPNRSGRGRTNFTGPRQRNNQGPRANQTQPRPLFQPPQPRPLLQPPQPPQAQLPTPQAARQAPPQPDITGLTDLFANWLKQNQSAIVQQPPALLPNYTCAAGMQPPMLHNPVVNPHVGQPPMLPRGGQQGFR